MNTKPQAEKAPEHKSPYSRPSVYLISNHPKVFGELTNARFNCESGSLGAIYSLIYNKYVRDYEFGFKVEIASNLHEFDLIVIDLAIHDRPLIPSRSNSEGVKNAGLARKYIICRPPQEIYDQRPINATIIHTQLEDARKRKAIIVVFAGKQIGSEYLCVTSTGTGANKVTYDLYSFVSEVRRMYFDNMEGKSTAIADNIESQELRGLLQKYNGEFQYEAIFAENNEITSYPLIRNQLGDLISFVLPETDDMGAVYVFPQLEIDSKAQFLKELCTNVLPVLHPTLFPELVHSQWLNDVAYLLPGEANVLTRKRELEAEYIQRLDALDSELKANADKWGFLHDIISGTGDELVTALEAFLNWLEFEQVVNLDRVKDEKTGQFHEDLQAISEYGLLLIETKGLSGRSSDRDCRQILGRRVFRLRELDRKDIYALYIANQERNLPPEQRTSPPFTDLQINDARDEERGLSTTYDLFKLFNWINDRIITKPDARKALYGYGLISFTPSDAVLIGRPQHLYKDGLVGIFDIADMTVNVGDQAIFSTLGNYQLATVESIQQDNSNVDAATHGNFGIKFDIPLHRNTELWVRSVVNSATTVLTPMF